MKPHRTILTIFYLFSIGSGCSDQPVDLQDDPAVTSSSYSLLNANNEYLPIAARTSWAGSSFPGNHGTFFADVTGDGKVDAIASRDNGLFVRRSIGTGFSTTIETWSSIGFWGGRGTFFVDVTGDGKADAIAVWDDAIYVRRATSSGFNSTNELWSGSFWGSRGTFFADVTGDGRADAIIATETGLLVRASNGNTFSNTSETWSEVGFWGGNGEPFFADVTGDGLADAIAIWPEGAYVRRSTGGSFGPNERWSYDAFWGNVWTFFADADGDGAADIIAVNSDGVWIRRSNRFQFGSNELWAEQSSVGSPYVADVSGDARADIIEVGSNGIQVSPSRLRNIKARFVQFVTTDTRKVTTSEIDNVILTANKVYGPAGLKIVRQGSVQEVTSDPLAHLYDNNDAGASATELAKARPYNSSCNIGTVAGYSKTEQLNLVATRCALTGEIVVYIADIGTSAGFSPWLGKTILMERQNIYEDSTTNMLFAHELGHFFGLPHIWEMKATKDPQTNTTSNALFWDLVYSKYNRGPPLSFKSRAEAAQQESFLSPIHNPSNQGWRCPSSDASKPCPSGTPDGALFIPVQDLSGAWVLYQSGNEMLKGVGLRLRNRAWTFNVMTYNYDPANPTYNQVTPALSLSQIEQIKRVLTFDVDTNVTSTSGALISSRRSLLGR